MRAVARPVNVNVCNHIRTHATSLYAGYIGCELRCVCVGWPTWKTHRPGRQGEGIVRDTIGAGRFNPTTLLNNNTLVCSHSSSVNAAAV